MSIFWVKGKPTETPEDWKLALKLPDRQWEPKHSAWKFAHSWEAAQDFPPEIRQLLMPHFANLTAVQGWVEWPAGLRGRGGPSCSDLLVHASSGRGDLYITIECKVAEPFDVTIQKWHTGTANREKRLSSILDIINLPRIIPETIRYQLLHRMASAVIAARKFDNAQHAIMIVHSFSDLDESFADFAALLSLYGVNQAEVGQLYFLRAVGNLNLYAGWARST